MQKPPEISQMTLFLVAKTSRDFVQQLVLFLPPRFQCPREDLLKILNPELAEILDSGGSDIGKKLEPAAFFFSL